MELDVLASGFRIRFDYPLISPQKLGVDRAVSPIISPSYRFLCRLSTPTSCAGRAAGNECPASSQGHQNNRKIYHQ